jgi:hypothetical protein
MSGADNTHWKAPPTTRGVLSREASASRHGSVSGQHRLSTRCADATPAASDEREHLLGEYKGRLMEVLPMSQAATYVPEQLEHLGIVAGVIGQLFSRRKPEATT